MYEQVITCYTKLGGSMSAVKITKIGNSQGFTIPKDLLEKGNFKLGDILEATLYNGKLIIFKAKPHHSKMKFVDPKLSNEDKVWADEDFGEWNA